MEATQNRANDDNAFNVITVHPHGGRWYVNSEWYVVAPDGSDRLDEVFGYVDSPTFEAAMFWANCFVNEPHVRTATNGSSFSAPVALMVTFTEEQVTC